ncbi:MAG: hypothetical protein JWO03_3006 [Bacteroidetes bacterium]|nr:hypothetical protein [Bacteroidota bacterium]
MSKSSIHNTPAKILGLSPEELEKIKEQFPYFNSARMLLLQKRQSTGSSDDIELSSSAVYSHDRRKLYDFLKKKNQSKPEATKDEEPIDYVQPAPEADETPEYSPVETQELNPTDISVREPEEVTPEEVILIEQEVGHIEEESLAAEEVDTPVAETIDAPVLSSPVAEYTAPEREPEEEPEEEETSTVVLPEARKFIIADHTFDEWLDHFKRGKHSVKKSLEDMPKNKEEAADELDRLIESSLPATFFHDKLESETQYAKGLENFIEVQKKKKATITKPAETGLVTETLAKIYERQGLVDKAISVYEQLILKNPEKSAYFAVQIERLKNK